MKSNIKIEKKGKNTDFAHHISADWISLRWHVYFTHKGL